jgi:hypothetical protein
MEIGAVFLDIRNSRENIWWINRKMQSRRGETCNLEAEFGLGLQDVVHGSMEI